MPQSLANVLIHLTFSTKGRRPFLTKDIRQELNAYLATILKARSSPALTIESVDDHVHILFSLSRTRTISEIVEEIKKSSSKWIKRKAEPLRQFQWQNGYGAFSLGQSLVRATKQYIQKQQEHHRKVSYQEEFRAFLEKNGIEYDERYVWD